MKKKRVVHMMVVFNDEEDISACGLWLVENPTMDWPKVTCKRCLKKRK